MTKFIGPAVLLIALIIAIGWYTKRNIDQGREMERLAQEKVNAQFVVRAKKGAVDFITCDRADGLFDFGKGTCELPTTSGSQPGPPRG